MESEQNNSHSCIRPDSPVEVDLTPKLPNFREANYEHSQSHNFSTQSREEGTQPKECCHGDPDCGRIKKEQLLKKSSSPEGFDVCLDSHTCFNAPASIVDTGISEHRDISTLAKNNPSTCNQKEKGERKNSRATISDSQRGGEREKKTDYNSISPSLGFGSCKNHLSEDKQNTESKFVFSEPQNTSGSGNNYSDLKAKSYDSLLRECHSSNNDVYKNKFGEYDEKEKIGAVGLSSQHKQDFSHSGKQNEYEFDQAATLSLQLNEVNHFSSEDFSRDWHSASHSNDTTELVLVESRVTTHSTIGETYNPDFGTVTASVKASKNHKSSSSSLRNPVEINAVEEKGNSVERTVKSIDGQEKERRETLIINSADTTGGLEEAEGFLSDSEFFTTANESTFLLLDHFTSTHPASDHKQKQHLIETDVHTSPRPENHNKSSINIHIRGQRAHADEVISIHKKGQRAPVEGNLQSISTQRAEREDTLPTTGKDQLVKSRKSEFSSRKYKIDGGDNNYSTTNDDNGDGSTRLFALGSEDIIFAEQESHFPNEGHHFLKKNPIFPGGVSASGQQLEKDRRKEGGVVSEGSACVGQDDNHHIVKSQEFNSSPAIIPLLCKATTLIPAQSLSDYNNYNSNNTQQQPWRQVTSDYYYTATQESPAEGRNITSPTSNWVCLSATTSTSDLLPRLNRGTVGFTGEEKNSVESTEDRKQSTVKTQNGDDDVVVHDTERKLRRNSSESCTTGQDQREKKRGRGNFGKCVPNELTTKKEEQLNGEDRGAEEENCRKSTHNYSEKCTQFSVEKQTGTVNANVNVASIGKQSAVYLNNEPLNTADVQSKCIPEANGHNDDFVDAPGSLVIVDKNYSDHWSSPLLDISNSSSNYRYIDDGKLLPEKQGKSDKVFSDGIRESADSLNEDKKKNKKEKEKSVRDSVASVCEKKSEKDHSQLPSVVDTEGTLTELRDSSTPIADTLKTPVRGHSQVDRVTNQNIDSDQADYQATSLRRSDSINTIADQVVDTGELSSIQVRDPKDVGAVPITVLSSTQVSEPQGNQSGRKKNPQRQRIVTSSTGKRILNQNFSPASKKTRREKKNQILAENFSRSFTRESEISKEDFNSREEETDVGNQIRILTGYFKETGVKTKTGKRKSLLTNPSPQREKITGGQGSKNLTPGYSPVSTKTDSRKNTSRERSRILTQLQSTPTFKGKHSFNEVALKRSSDTSKTNPTSKKQGRDSEASQSDLNPSKKFKGGVTSEAGDQNKQTFPVTDGDTLNPSLQVNCSLEKNSTQSADISGCSETSDITKVFKKSSTTVFKASHNSGCGGDKIRKDTNLPNSPSLGYESCERNAATLGEVTATDAVDDISHTALPEGKGASRSKHRQITGLEGNSSVLNTKTSVTGTEVKTCDKWEDLKGVTIGTAVNEVVTLNDDYSGGGDSDINDSGIDVIRRHAYKWGALISPDSDPVKATVKPTHDTDVTFKLTATGDAGHPSNLKDVTNHLRNSPFVSQIPLGGGEKSSHNDIGGETGEIEGKSVGSCNISQNDNSLYVNTNVNSETVHYSVDKSDRNIEFTGTPSHHWRNDSLNTTAELSVNESSLGSTQKRKRKLSRRGLSNLFQRRSKKVKPCVEEAGDTVDKNIAPVIINAEKSKENRDQKIQKKVGRVTRALLPDRLKVTKHKKTTITTKESGVKKQDSYSDKHPSNPPRQSPSVNLIIKDRTNLPSNEDLRSGEGHQTPKLKLKEKLTQEALETPLGDENPFLGVKNQLLSNLKINKKVSAEQEKVILQTYTVKMERQNPLLRVPNSSSPGSLGARGNPHLRNSGSQLSRNKGGSPMVSQTLPLKLASSSKISSNKTKKQKKQQQEGLNAASPLEKGQVVDNSSKEGSQEERGSRTPVLGVLSAGKDMETKGGRRKIMGLFETADKRKVPQAGETECAKHIGDTEHSRLIPDDFDDDLIADVDGNCNVTVTGTAWNSSSIPRLNGSCLPTESTPRFNQSGKTVSHGVSTLNSKLISVKDKSEKKESLRTDYSGSYIKNNSKTSLMSGDSKTDLNVGNKRVLQSPDEQNMLKFVKTNSVSNGAKASEKVSSDLMEHSAMVTESSNHIEAHSATTRSNHDKNVHDVEHTHDSKVNAKQQNDSVVEGTLSQEETKEIIIETIFPSKVRDSPSPSRGQREEPTVEQVPSVVRNPKTRSASQLPMHLEKSFRTSSMRSNLKDQKSILPTHLEKTQSQSKLRKTLSRASMMKSAAKIASNKLKMENTSEGHEKGDTDESGGQVQNIHGHTVPVLDASKLSKSKLQPRGSVQKTKTSEEKSSQLPVKSPSSKVSHVTDKQPIRRSPLRQDSRGSGIQDKTKDRFGSQGSVASDSSNKVSKTLAVSGQKSNNIVPTSNSRRSMSPRSPSTSSIPRRSLSPKTTGSKMSPTRKRNDSTGSDRRGSTSSSLSKGNIEKVRSSVPDKSLVTRQETKNTSPKASDSRRMAGTPSGGRGVGGVTPTQRTRQAGASGVPRTPLTSAPPPQKPTSSKPKTHCSSRYSNHFEIDFTYLSSILSKKRFSPKKSMLSRMTSNNLFLNFYKV
ncbi:uncharacterized protein LOC112041558 [Lingula anatina]|uniref:Uncharacterized protein LOC112041558 n=1 Tax=Lingula anatina TaxID=7574 RepID=A0A2R2MKX2_LINAN|nr:uncharacterized protein LOC112041558 [Lingula anatina]|eukprot:XP_023930712.1 uncharacterized protein LOC112041558 [Lingula anatina]